MIRALALFLLIPSIAVAQSPDSSGSPHSRVNRSPAVDPIRNDACGATCGQRNLQAPEHCQFLRTAHDMIVTEVKAYYADKGELPNSLGDRYVSSLNTINSCRQQRDCEPLELEHSIGGGFKTTLSIDPKKGKTGACAWDGVTQTLLVGTVNGTSHLVGYRTKDRWGLASGFQPKCYDDKGAPFDRSMNFSGGPGKASVVYSDWINNEWAQYSRSPSSVLAETTPTTQPTTLSLAPVPAPVPAPADSIDPEIQELEAILYGVGLGRSSDSSTSQPQTPAPPPAEETTQDPAFLELQKVLSATVKDMQNGVPPAPAVMSQPQPKTADSASLKQGYRNLRVSQIRAAKIVIGKDDVSPRLSLIPLGDGKTIRFAWSNGAYFEINLDKKRLSASNFLAPDDYNDGCRTEIRMWPVSEKNPDPRRWFPVISPSTSISPFVGRTEYLNQ